MAYTNVWDNTKPTGSEAANTISATFRQFKLDITERLNDIFGTMPAFTTDPLRPYGLKFTDSQDAVISMGDNAGTPRSIIIKDKAGATTYYTFSSTKLALGASVGLDLNGTPPSAAASHVIFGGSVRTTIGANGAATALTANPLGYVDINVAGTIAQIPYYNRGA